jgi:hypothetical protein
MARILSSDARLSCVSLPSLCYPALSPYISKLSFQYGFRVFLMTEVVRVCSPCIVATANGSGNPGAKCVSRNRAARGLGR